MINTVKSGQNGRHFADDIFKCILLKEQVFISIQISMKFVCEGQLDIRHHWFGCRASGKSSHEHMMIQSTYAFMGHQIIMNVVIDEQVLMQIYLLSTGLSPSWLRNQLETFSALLAICAGNSPVTGEFRAQRPVTRSFDVFFDLRLNRRLSKQ